MKKKLTDTFIKNLKPKDKRQEFNDDGLFLVINSGDPDSTKIQKKFYFVYYPDGKRKLIPIGVYGERCTLSYAKKVKSKLKNDYDNGIDIQETQKDIKTVKELVLYWYEKYVVVNRKPPYQVERLIHADIIPLLGNVKLKDITTRKITLALDKIVERGSPIHANRVLSALKQMFNYAISKGIYVGNNPLAGTKANDVGGKEKPRERNLTMQELITVWQYLDSGEHQLPKGTINAIKLLILTGCRLSEVKNATWSEFDFDNNLWTISKERYKTGLEHKIYLTSQMAKLLSELKNLSGKSKFILPSTVDINRPLSDKSLSRAIARSQDRIGIDKFTIHDLRRSFASRMADYLDIDVVVIEKLLGHKLPKIFATYQKSEMLEQRKDALEKWSDKIEILVTNENIIPFRKVG